MTDTNEVRPGLPVDPMELLSGVLEERGWDKRPGQVAMVEAISNNGKGHPQVAVTAPVGTGKTLGYLCGALPFSRRIVIATSTKALQTQIVQQELPELQKNLKDRYGYDLTFMSLKGKSNYIDLSKVASMLKVHAGDSSTADMSLMELEEIGDVSSDKYTAEHWEILEAAYNATIEAKESGDFQNLDQDEALASLPPGMAASAAVDKYSKEASKKWPTGAEENLVDRVIARSKCAYRTAYANAMKVDILVVNTSLLASEMVKMRYSMSGLTPQFLPETDVVIIDEAHHASAKFIEALQVRHDVSEFRRGSTKFLGKMRKAGLDESLLRVMTESIENYVAQLTELVDQGQLKRSVLARAAASLTDELITGTSSITAASGASKSLLVLTKMFREEYIKELREVTDKALSKTDESQPSHMVSTQWLSAIKRNSNISYEDDTPVISLVPVDLTSVAPEISTLCREFQPYLRGTEGFEEEGEMDMLSSLDGGKGFIALCSGTMTKDAPHDIGMDDVDYYTVDSPFSPHAQKLFLPGNLPGPSGKTQDDWLEKSWEVAKRAIEKIDGRTLFLCTSFKSMQYFTERAAAELTRTVYVQTKNSNKRDLIEAFTNDENSVLFGTLVSFGEGVDIPGSTLSLVIMDKINFPIPDDPIHKARVEASRRRGKGDFKVSIEAASVMMAQGAGRLIRSLNCYGGVMVLDPRLVKSNYGKSVMALLPMDSEFTEKEADFLAYLDIVKESILSSEPLPAKAFGGSWKPLKELGAKKITKARR